MGFGYGSWKRYVPVAIRREKAMLKARKLTKPGKPLQPVSLEGRTIARSFWGKGWCAHLEAFSDFQNRLPRGRSYVRNGSVCHLAIQAGRIDALVTGSSLYRVTVETAPLPPAAWGAIKRKCSGEIGSLLELLQGKVSDQVMRVVTDRASGLFPQPGEMNFKCSCPDWASMCKHVAAVLYGVGSRLDEQPKLLFLLRDVDPGELIGASLNLQTTAESSEGRLAADQLGAIFGIELDPGASTTRDDDASRTSLSERRAGRSAKPMRSSAAQSRTSSQNTPAGGDPPATGESVAALRAKHRLTVSEFARRLSVSPASVQRWEAIPGALNLQTRCLVALTELQRELVLVPKKRRSTKN